MMRQEIHAHLTEKIEAEWGAYRQAMLQLPSVSVFARAHDIHNAREYSIGHLEYLMTLPNPLETVREQRLTQESGELE